MGGKLGLQTSLEMASQPYAPENEARVFLVVVDESAERQVALHYACLRARHINGRVALLHVIEPPDSQQWIAVQSLMRQERQDQANALIEEMSREVFDWSGQLPIVYLREGVLRDELLKLIDEEAAISIVVLGASTGPEGPGPLVSLLIGKMAGRLRVPVTIVPGRLSDAELAALT
jgi:nucleotide-binding universal stress UspA family protein